MTGKEAVRRLLHHRVLRGGTHDVETVEQRNAGGVQRAESAGEARDLRLLRQGAEHRDLELQLVGEAAAAVALPDALPENSAQARETL